MKKYLIPNEGKFYKANLHMHTTVSDGVMTPLETKEAYMREGYSIVAFSDHEVLVPHAELTDENFLAINSTEISVNLTVDVPFSFIKCYHLNLFSKNPTKDFFNTFCEEYVGLEQSKKYVTEEQKHYKNTRLYTIEYVNSVIKKAKEEGFLVSYNHPVWSIQSHDDYIGLKGLWAVEWHNTGCVVTGHKDTIVPVDDLLRVGERVFPIATDDAHEKYDCFGGWVMVKANNLEYDTIFNALEKGDFYSSNKPVIEELYLLDGKIYIKTSKAVSIRLTTDSRFALAVNGKNLTSAEFDINYYLEVAKEKYHKHQYVRITVVDEAGNEAHTRAYFIDELI